MTTPPDGAHLPRSAALGWLVAAALLILGVPLFLRMPLWCDTTLYAVAAHAISSGGTHYQDVFDTNPPGFVWALALVRGVFGTSDLATRGADLGVAGAVVAGLVCWARRAGASRTGAAWLVASAAAFYPFVHEFNHVQRDTWMLAPALAAIALRLWRAERRPAFTLAVAEGAVWGLGCWIKPHLLFVAAGAWLATLPKLRTRDTFWVFAGGVLALLAGLGWLSSTGAWPHFVDVWRTWNADYLATVVREFPFRVMIQLSYFPPYSICALLAVPLAVANVRTTSAEPEAVSRKTLAAVYLGWLLTALLLQRPFHYVHVPETLLMLAVFAANRWPVPGALVLVQLGAGVLFVAFGWNVAHAPPHVAFQWNRTRWWAECLRPDATRDARRGVAMWHQHFGGHDPVELGAVADYLREQHLRDRELIAWHDSPHALYLALDIKPGFRFMHVGTAAGLGRWQEEQVLRELQAALPHARFAVSDMNRITEKYGSLNEIDPDGLPSVLPAWQRGEFPFNQPVVFRSPGGRYLVHRIERPVTSARIPERLDQHEPPK